MTKNNLKILVTKSILVVGVLFMAFACSNSNTPEAVAEKFLNHMAKGEFAEAKALCDSDTASLIGMMEGMAGDQKPSADEVATITIISSEVKEDKAKVNYTSSAEEGEKTLDLTQIDGAWKVSFDKENQNKEEAIPEEESYEDLLEEMDELQMDTEEVVEEIIEEVTE